MADERALAAIHRIEQALARIEAAAARPKPAAGANPDDLSQLRHVHQALRTKVEGAISQIDELLGAEAH